MASGRKIQVGHLSIRSLIWGEVALKRGLTFGIAWCIALAVGVAVTAPPVLAADFGPVQPMEFDAMKAALGKRLFFDPRLSGDAAISCSTCHRRVLRIKR